MSIKINTVGYIKYMAERTTIGNDNCSFIKFRVATERENYKKYDLENNEKQEKDVITCIAFGNVADYIYECYNKVKGKDFKKLVRVDIGGFMEVNDIPIPGNKMQFIVKDLDTGEFLKDSNGKDEVVELEIDDDLYFKVSVPKVVVKEVTFIDLECEATSTVGKRAKRVASVKNIVDKAKKQQEESKSTSKKESIDEDDIDVDDALNEIIEKSKQQ